MHVINVRRAEEAESSWNVTHGGGSEGGTGEWSG